MGPPPAWVSSAPRSNRVYRSSASIAPRREPLPTCRRAPTDRHRRSASRAGLKTPARSDARPSGVPSLWAAGTPLASGASLCPAPHDIGTVGCQSSSSSPSSLSRWEAARHGPREPTMRPHGRPTHSDARRPGVCRRTGRGRGFAGRRSKQGGLPKVPAGLQRREGAGGSRRRHLQRRTARVHD